MPAMTLSAFLLLKFPFITVCTGFPCPSGSICRECQQTGSAYCEYSCSINNGGCPEGATCRETPNTCPPGQCCSLVNVTCEGKLNQIHILCNYTYSCISFIQHIMHNVYSISYQLIGRKKPPNFWPLKYFIEHTVALIQCRMTYNCRKANQ